jgi:broad specificity phosphatase PhoE
MTSTDRLARANPRLPHRPLTLLLVRHGQSEWNAAGLLQGQTPDVPLTALGHSQARAAAHALAPLKPGALISSDLLSATQTADHCARQLGLPNSTSPALREQGYGVLEGRESSYAVQVVEWWNHGWAADGGESLAQLHHRVGNYLRELCAAPPADVVALVTHGDTIRAAQAVAAGQGPDALPNITPHNGTVTVLRMHRWAGDELIENPVSAVDGEA